MFFMPVKGVLSYFRGSTLVETVSEPQIKYMMRSPDKPLKITIEILRVDLPVSSIRATS